MLGICKWFNDAKGYGFLTANAREYFVHFKSITGDGYKSLRPNDEVEFEPQTNAKGQFAANVKIVKRAIT